MDGEVNSSPPVTIDNPQEGGVLYWLIRQLLFLGWLLFVASGLLGITVYQRFAADVPSTPDLAQFAKLVGSPTKVFAADGTLLGDFTNTRRILVPYEEIPTIVTQAFIAIEDRDYFDHHGISWKGTLRAVRANMGSGRFSQGGSTITQQLAKQFLGSEKSLARKVREAILARRLESKYSKKAILAAYLGKVYLGSGAYGIAAAAKRYFQKELKQLSIEEAALLAGLARSPSNDSPLASLKRATDRRNQVLEAMAESGVIQRKEALNLSQKPIVLKPAQSKLLKKHPYYVAHIKQELQDSPNVSDVYDAGLRVETAVAVTEDRVAYESVQRGARKQDKRQGWRGPAIHLETKHWDRFRKRSKQRYRTPLQLGKKYLGLVTAVTYRHADIEIAGASYLLPLKNGKWANPWSARSFENDIEIVNLTTALRPGDVIWVRLQDAHQRALHDDWFLAGGVNPRWRPPVDKTPPTSPDGYNGLVELEQIPYPQVSIFSADYETGYVHAMVGGNNFQLTPLNRALHSCRQPGSTYKPIYYSAALDKGYGFDSILLDRPSAVADSSETGSTWTPENFGGSVHGEVSLEYSLVFSKNASSVYVFLKVGAENVANWARKLGFTDTIIADRALALGASCTRFDQLVRAYAIFARHGRWVDWIYTKRVVGPNGNTLLDKRHWKDVSLTSRDRILRIQHFIANPPPKAIPPRTAYLTSKLLRAVIRSGFSSIVRSLKIPAAGKTGTSSNTMDMSFVGYTSRRITGVWIGDDKLVRPLGRDDAAYMTALPLWAQYLAQTSTPDMPYSPLPKPPPTGVKKTDRGSHSVGKRFQSPMPLVYHKQEKPEEPTPPPSL